MDDVLKIVRHSLTQSVCARQRESMLTFIDVALTSIYSDTRSLRTVELENSFSLIDVTFSSSVHWQDFLQISLWGTDFFFVTILRIARGYYSFVMLLFPVDVLNTLDIFLIWLTLMFRAEITTVIAVTHVVRTTVVRSDNGHDLQGSLTFSVEMQYEFRSNIPQSILGVQEISILRFSS